MLPLEYNNSRMMPVHRIRAVRRALNIEHRTSNKIPLKLPFFLVVFMSLILLPNNSFAQSNRNLPPGGDCSNMFQIDPTHSLQIENIDMSDLSSFYISFQATDTSFYFEILSDGEFPTQLELYDVDCNGGLILASELYTDTTESKSIELYPHNLIINNYYMIKIDQNAQNSVGSLIMAFKNPIPEVPCCQPPKPPCADIMYNGSFEIDDISPTGISLDEKIHLSHGYLLLSSQHNRGDYYHPKGNSFSQPPNTILGNNIYPVTTPDGNDAYAGIFTTYTSLNNSSYGGAGEFREWICGQINTPNSVMEAGTRYYVNMQVHLSDDNLYSSGSVPPGIRFSAQPTTTNSQIDIVNMTADIQSNDIITNNTSWHTVDGFYTATGNEHFVTIANFQSDALSFNGGGFNKSYFFIDAISIIPADLCCTELIIPDDDWDTGDLLNSQDFALFINGNTLEDIDVNVEGTFTVNSDLTLKNVQFNMSPNSKIIVNNGSTFTLDNSKLKVCGDTMWEGVEVINSDAEIIMKNNSEIWDAKIGILSTNGGNFTINDSYFNSNDYGIFVDEYLTAKHEGTVVGTTFDATHNLLYPINTNMASAGIYLYEVANKNGLNDILIGNANKDPNHFNTPKATANKTITDGLKYGIHAVRSTFKVVNCIFENFTQITSPSVSDDKSGIKIEGLDYNTYYGGYAPTAIIGDMSLNGNNQNKFLKSSSAISLDGIQNIVVKNNMIYFQDNQLAPYTTEYVIEVDNNYWSAEDCVIDNNYIEGVVNGIRIGYVYELTNVSVSYNTIELSNLPGNTGIYLNNVSPTNIVNYEIANNDITKVTRGIEVNTGIVPQISFNRINLNTTITNSIPNYGVLVNSTLFSNYFPTIEKNLIMGDVTTSNTDVNGISVANFNYNLPILCNDIYKTGTAIYMDYVDLINLSVFYDIFANNMDNNYNCLVLDNNSNLQNIGYYNNYSNNFFGNNNTNFHALAIGSAADLFVHGTSLPTYPINNAGINIITTQSSGFICIEEEGRLTAETPKINSLHPQKKGIDFLPDFTEVATSDTLQWLSKYHYYRLLLNDSITSNVVQAFKDSLDIAPLGQLLAVEHQIDTSRNKHLGINLETISSKVSQESLLKTVLQQKALQKSQAWDTLPATALNILAPIAQACPLEAGPAVLSARALIYRYTGKRYHNACEGYVTPKKAQNHLKSFEEPDTENDRIEVYPNPAKNELTVEVVLKLGDFAEFEVYDIQGKLLLVKTLHKNNNNLSLEDLSKGIYIYRIKDSKSSLLKTDKLIIQ